MPNSRAKGKRRERELARLFTDEGYPAKRGGFMQVRAGSSEGADVLCDSLPWLHVEAKGHKTFMGAKLRAAIEQAERDRKVNTLASVWHKEDHSPWYVTMEAHDLFRIIRGEFLT